MLSQSDSNLRQALHPLQNSPIVPLLPGSSSQLPFSLATCYELSWTLAEAWNALELQKSRAVNVQISHLNRLQRSYLMDQVAAVHKDSTVQSAKFLVGVLRAVETYLRGQLQTPTYSKVSVCHCHSISFVTNVSSEITTSFKTLFTSGRERSAILFNYPLKRQPSRLTWAICQQISTIISFMLTMIVLVS